RAFSRSSHQQFKRKIFYYGIEEKYIRNYSLETDGRTKVLVLYLSIILLSDFKFYNLLSEWVITYRRIHLQTSSIQDKLEEIQYQPLEQSDVKELIHDVLNELQSRKRHCKKKTKVEQ